MPIMLLFQMCLFVMLLGWMHAANIIRQLLTSQQLALAGWLLLLRADAPCMALWGAGLKRIARYVRTACTLLSKCDCAARCSPFVIINATVIEAAA